MEQEPAAADLNTSSSGNEFPDRTNTPDQSRQSAQAAGWGSEMASGGGGAPEARGRALRIGQDRFVRLWGEMGNSWGIPRTMAEVHALLYISGKPMNTDQIMARLSISRGSASMSLKSLADWGLIQRVHKRGDRKEYFRAEHDVWQIFRIIVRERKRREIDPVLMALYDCRDTTSDRSIGPKAESNTEIVAHNRRLDDMLGFIRLVDSIAEQFTGPGGGGLKEAAGLLEKGGIQP